MDADLQFQILKISYLVSYAEQGPTNFLCLPLPVDIYSGPPFTKDKARKRFSITYHAVGPSVFSVVFAIVRFINPNTLIEKFKYHLM